MKSKKTKTMAKGKGKGHQVTTAETSDLVLALNGNTLETTISPNAEFAGIQKFVEQGNMDGVTSMGNWNYWWAPSDGTETVQAQGSGHYRSWSNDADGTLHTSNWITIP